MTWDEVISAVDAEEVSRAEQALRGMLTAARRAALQGDAEPLIALQICFSREANPSPAEARCDIEASRDDEHIDAHLKNGDLRAMADAEEGILRCVAYALAAKFRQTSPPRWRKHPIGQARPPDGLIMNERLEHYQMLDSDGEIGRHLRAQRDILLYGTVGSGKTVAATYQARRWAQAGHRVIWLDLTDPFDGDESVAYALLTMPRVESVLLVLDNAQANISAARAVVDLVRQLRARLGLPILLFATGSHSVARENVELGLTLVAASGSRLVQAMLDNVDSLPAEQKRVIERLAGEDGAIARIAIDLWAERGQLPEGDAFADAVAEKLGADTVSPAARALLYKLACLALFNIGLTRREIDDGERPALEELQRAGLIRLNEDAYTIARSMGRLLVQHAYRAWAGDGLRSPDRVAYDYLQRAGEEQIQATLDQLDLIPLTTREDPQNYTSLASAWGALRFLADRLSQRTHQDPTWGDGVASAAFAGMALVEMGRYEAWQKCAEFVRGRMIYASDGQLPAWGGEPSSDLAAFHDMSDLIRDESEFIARAETGAPPAHSHEMDAADACKVWLLGILLSFEAKAPDRDPAVIGRLAAIAEAASQSGALYSREAPWVTAQVVLGLCLAGRDLHNETVQNACRWLARDPALGGVYNRGWQSGVSGITAEVMTSALCLSALLHAGWPNAEQLITGYKSLCAAQERLEATGQETELALIAEARLRNGDEWDKLSPAILNLLAWAVQSERSTDLDVKATRPGDPLSATSKTPFIAVQLWIIIWTITKRELRQLLRELGGFDWLTSTNGVQPPQGSSPEAGRTVSGAGLAALGILPARRIRRALDTLHREIEQNISDRARQIPELGRAEQDVFEQNIQLWQDRLRRLEIIDAEIEAGDISTDTLSSLNGLGVEVFQSGWNDIAGDS